MKAAAPMAIPRAAASGACTAVHRILFVAVDGQVVNFMCAFHPNSWCLLHASHAPWHSLSCCTDRQSICRWWQLLCFCVLSVFLRERERVCVCVCVCVCVLCENLQCMTGLGDTPIYIHAAAWLWLACIHSTVPQLHGLEIGLGIWSQRWLWVFPELVMASVQVRMAACVALARQGPRLLLLHGVVEAHALVRCNAQCIR